MEHLRIDEQVVHPAVDHVHALRPVHRAHVGAVVVGDEQVAAFDQFDAHGLRQVGVLEVGAVEHARRQQRDHRRVARARRERGQGVVQLAGVLVHRQDRAGLEQFREHALGHHAVFQHVADAAGDAQVVFQRVQRAVAVAHQIRAADVRPHAQGRRDADALRAEVHRILQQHRREHLVLDDLLPAVDVADEQVQRAHALLQAGFGALPFAERDDARNQVERQRAVDVAAVGVHGEGDALHARHHVGGELAFGEFAAGQSGQVFDQAACGRSRPSIGLDQFVKGRGAVLRPVHSPSCCPGRRIRHGVMRRNMPARRSRRQASHRREDRLTFFGAVLRHSGAKQGECGLLFRSLPCPRRVVSSSSPAPPVASAPRSPAGCMPTATTWRCTTGTRPPTCTVWSTNWKPGARAAR